MVFLIEEQKYKENILNEYLGQYGHKEGKVVCVGYFFKMNSEGKGEPVYLLPKVFAEKMVPHGQVMEPILIHRDNDEKSYRWDKTSEELLNSQKEKGKKWNAKMFYELSSWLYRALDHYRSRLIENNIIHGCEGYVFQASKDDYGEEITLQDMIFALEHFYHTHQDLFIFVQKKAHSRVNKIDWAKTVRKGQAVISQNINTQISYDSVYGTRREFDFDEKLIVLFFNTLVHLQSEGYYDFSITHSYHLISPNKFEIMVESGKILSELKSIRNNYFNDQMRELWKLLNAYYSKRDQMQHSRDKVDYLLTTYFNRVFEDMIDYILGDRPGQYPKDLKKQAGGTRLIDHLFLGASLFDKREIYYVGDSKYYSEKRPIEEQSICKEYDYVTNMVQMAMEARNKQRNWGENNEIAHHYYDSLSKGYNITPNFFIRGRLESDYDFKDTRFEEFELKLQKIENKGEIPENKRNYFRSHFPHLLFDRNTLWLLEYSINILFVLKVYGAQAMKNARTSTEQIEKAKQMKASISRKIREDLLRKIRDKFTLYKMSPKKDIDGQLLVSKEECLSLIKRNLYRIEGMVFSSAKNMELLIFAQPKECDSIVMEEIVLAKEELKKVFQFVAY